MNRKTTKFDNYFDSLGKVLNLSKTERLVFEDAVSKSRNLLIKRNLLESWEPSISVKTKKDLLSLTEQKVLFLTFLKAEKQGILFEEISSEIPFDVNAAMKSQILAVKKLRQFYQNLPKDKQERLDGMSNNFNKSKYSFIEEIQDIENEINGIYGKLETGGFFSNLLKKGFGYFQRGLGSLGAGKVSQIDLDEKHSIPLLAANSPLFSQVRDAVVSAVSDEKRNLISRQAIEQIAGRFHVSPTDVANAAHSAGVNVPSVMGTMSQVSNAASVAAVNPTPVAAAASQTQPAAAVVGSKLSMPLMAKLGIDAGIAGLVAAGAAGIKMRNRRKRIENLQVIARQFGATEKYLPKTIENPAVENPKKAETTDSSSNKTGELSSSQIPQTTENPVSKKTQIGIGNTGLQSMRGSPPENKVEAKEKLGLDPNTNDEVAAQKANKVIRTLSMVKDDLKNMETNAIISRERVLNENFEIFNFLFEE